MDGCGDPEALDDDEPFRLLGRPLSPGFLIRVVMVGRGRQRAVDEREWRDALVVLERGEVELECEGGSRSRFGAGAVLCLTGLPLRTVHQRGPDPTLLVSVRRRRHGR